MCLSTISTEKASNSKGCSSFLTPAGDLGYAIEHPRQCIVCLELSSGGFLLRHLFIESFVR